MQLLHTLLPRRTFYSLLGLLALSVQHAAALAVPGQVPPPGQAPAQCPQVLLDCMRLNADSIGLNVADCPSQFSSLYSSRIEKLCGSSLAEDHPPCMIELVDDFLKNREKSEIVVCMCSTN